MGPLEVLSPVPPKRQDAGGLAPRIGEFAGRTVGLLDDGHTSAGFYLRSVGKALEERGAQVRYWRKPILSRPSPQSLLDEIKDSVDAVVVGAAA